ncbi:MAG: shikimate kinase [Trichlorobacter sp.]|jgi:shikimate kinase
MLQSVVLTGPMGSGKTSVGQLLADRLGWAFVDLDALIVERAGKSINAIFHSAGEAAFRQLEQEQLAALVGRKQIVLSTGGGAVINPENRCLMRLIGVVVNLTAPLDVLVTRLDTADDRPLLQGEEPRAVKLARLLAEREGCYADSDIRIDTAAKSVEDVAAEVLERLSEG